MCPATSTLCHQLKATPRSGSIDTETDTVLSRCEGVVEEPECHLLDVFWHGAAGAQIHGLLGHMGGGHLRSLREDRTHIFF